MLEQRMIRENELAALKRKHAEEMHTAKLEMIKQQTEVFSLQADLLKKTQSLPQYFLVPPLCEFFCTSFRCL
mgnify:CR=1 FL=1